METAIVLIWAVGLVGALVATGAILKLAALVLATLRDILALAERTSRAAEGVAENLAPLPRLREVHGPEARTRRAAGALREILAGREPDPGDPGPGAGGEAPPEKPAGGRPPPGARPLHDPGSP